MPTIRVRRTAKTYAALRKLQVLVDGTPRASLSRGNSVDIDVTPGRHEVAVKMDWARTPPLTVECREGSVTTVEAGGPGLGASTFYTFVSPSKVFGLTLHSSSAD
jgi:hypothetical protein